MTPQKEEVLRLRAKDGEPLFLSGDAVMPEGVGFVPARSNNLIIAALARQGHADLPVIVQEMPARPRRKRYPSDERTPERRALHAEAQRAYRRRRRRQKELSV